MGSRIGIFVFMVLFLAIIVWGKPSSDYEFTIPGSEFDLGVRVLVTSDLEYAVKYVQKNLDSTVQAGDFDARGVTFPSRDGLSPIVWIPNLDDPAVVQHELLHATIDIMKWASVPLTEDTEEVYAYELQYLTTQFNSKTK